MNGVPAFLAACRSPSFRVNSLTACRMRLTGHDKGLCLWCNILAPWRHEEERGRTKAQRGRWKPGYVYDASSSAGIREWAAEPAMMGVFLVARESGEMRSLRHS